MRLFRKPLSMILGLAAIVPLVGNVATSQVGGQAPPCRCKPVFSLNPDPACPCPGIIFTNITAAQFGKCTKDMFGCVGENLRKCKVVGTVTETGCSGGLVDEPFTLSAECLGAFDNMVDLQIGCSGGGVFGHRVRLDCRQCK